MNGQGTLFSDGLMLFRKRKARQGGRGAGLPATHASGMAQNIAQGEIGMPEETIDAQEYASALDEMRREKDAYFGADPDSPILQEGRPDFVGLKYRRRGMKIW
jgi:hypothetical protein